MYDELLRRLEAAEQKRLRKATTSAFEISEGCYTEAAAAIRDLQAKLDAVKPRPIEDAPKDGSTLLALWDGHWVETYWAKRDKFEGWQMPSGMVVKAYAPDTWKPTHFIPLSAITALATQEQKPC